MVRVVEAEAGNGQGGPFRSPGRRLESETRNLEARSRYVVQLEISLNATQKEPSPMPRTFISRRAGLLLTKIDALPEYTGRRWSRNPIEMQPTTIAIRRQTISSLRDWLQCFWCLHPWSSSSDLLCSFSFAGNCRLQSSNAKRLNGTSSCPDTAKEAEHRRAT
jgi:hypothetical protein